MNASKAIELAVARTLRKFAEIGEGVLIRAWQSPTDEGDMQPERQFPLVIVKAEDQSPDPVQTTSSIRCVIMCMTNNDDDQSMAGISLMYEAVNDVCDDMVKLSRTGSTTTEPYFTLIENISDLIPSTRFTALYLRKGAEVKSLGDASINAISREIMLHYHDPYL